MTLLPLGFSLPYFPSVICLECIRAANCTLCLRLVALCFPSSFPSLWMWLWTRERWGVRPPALVVAYFSPGLHYQNPLSYQSLWKRKQNSFTLKQFWGFRILIKWQKNTVLKCFLFLEKLCTFKNEVAADHLDQVTKVYASNKWLSEYRWSLGLNELVPDFYWYPSSYNHCQ